MVPGWSSVDPRQDYSDADAQAVCDWLNERRSPMFVIGRFISKWTGDACWTEHYQIDDYNLILNELTLTEEQQAICRGLINTNRGDLC